jgi:hypothetical protein
MDFPGHIQVLAVGISENRATDRNFAFARSQGSLDGNYDCSFRRSHLGCDQSVVVIQVAAASPRLPITQARNAVTEKPRWGKPGFRKGDDGSGGTIESSYAQTARASMRFRKIGRNRDRCRIQKKRKLSAMRGPPKDTWERKAGVR